jgi:hypothetical protein
MTVDHGQLECLPRFGMDIRTNYLRRPPVKLATKLKLDLILGVFIGLPLFIQ